MAQQPLIATRVDPWHQPVLQSRLALMRLSASAAAAAIVADGNATAVSTTTALRDATAHDATPTDASLEMVSMQAEGHAISSASEADVTCIDAALAVLAAAPPGAEGVALQALDSVLRPDSLDALLCGAQQALRQFAVRSQHLVSAVSLMDARSPRSGGSQLRRVFTI